MEYFKKALGGRGKVFASNSTDSSPAFLAAVVNDLEGRYQTTIQKMKYVMRSRETDCAATVSNDILSELGK